MNSNKGRYNIDQQENGCFDRNVIPINTKDQGAQGFVYKCLWENKAAILKISNYIDFVLELEEEAWNKLKTLNCIHFCEVFDKLPLKPGGNSYCLFYKEIINNQRNDSLANLVYEQNHHPIAFLNCIRQTLAAISMFETLGITHYDLHADNVMIADTNYDVHLYKLGDHLIPIRTFGLAPVIIDFGMAFIPNMHYNATCVFSKHGFTTFMDDPLVDSRLLLVTIIKDLKDLLSSFKMRARKYINYNTKYRDIYTLIEKFVKKIEHIFKPLNILDNGWYKNEDIFPDIINKLIDSLPTIFHKFDKGIFKLENIGWVIELLQHDIILPLEYKENTLSFRNTTTFFAINWKKNVESVIRNTKEEYVFFKDLISIPCDSNPESYIKLKHKYSKIKNLMQLRTDARNMANAINNYMYDKSFIIKDLKKSLYNRLPYKTTTDILVNLPKSYNNYKEGMTILVMDPLNPNHRELYVDGEMAIMLNENEQETYKNILSKQNNEETQRVHY
jgi:serine/threonine protein kinase